MPNLELRQAMADAKMTTRRLAQEVGVDEKTVQRWLTMPERFPHPQHRWKTSDVLGVDETVLWPAVARLAVKIGTDREIAQTWPYRSEMPNSTWGTLFKGAEKDVLLAGWTCYFFWFEIHNLPRLIRWKVAQGCRIRFLIGDPDDPATAEREIIENVAMTLTVRLRVTLDQLEPLKTLSGLEVRIADRRIMGTSVFKFDDQAIVTSHLATTIGTDAPTFRLRRLQDDGLFDRYVRDHAEKIWTDARPLW